MPPRNLRSSGISEQQQRIDVTALVTAKLLYDATGDRTTMENFLAEMHNDPQRMGQCMLGILNLLAQYATASGYKPNGLQNLANFLIKTLKDNTSIRRIAN